MSQDGIILSVKDLSVSYGNVRAIKDISFAVREGEIVALVGANGAGKSSTLGAISGRVRYDGTIIYRGRDVRGLSANRRVGLGIVHVPEGRGIFGNLKVIENLRLATWIRKDKRELARDYARVFDLFPVLYDRREQPGGTLSGGEQQMLALSRALMVRPDLMLLDEPSMGIAPVLVRNIFSVLKEINRAGTTILLVEQNAQLALKTASFAHVLETGSIALSGPGPELLDNPLVMKAYLG
jgi:branched-chain amino acid transport system ATP-binding protein